MSALAVEVHDSTFEAAARYPLVKDFSSMATAAWPKIVDEALVEKLIPAIQQVIADICAIEQGIGDGEQIPVQIADLSNVLLMLLATVLEPLPACSTPRGIRLLAETAAKELATMISDTRRLKLAALQEPGSLQWQGASATAARGASLASVKKSTSRPSATGSSAHW